MIFAFLLGMYASVPVIALFSVWGLLCERADSGWSLFHLIVAGVAALIYFKIPSIYILYGIPAYVTLGFIWSFFRYNKYVSETLKDFKKHPYNRTLREVKQKLRPSLMAGSITYWVLVWPLSLVANFIGDGLEFISDLIRGTFHNIYLGILNSQFKSFEAEEVRTNFQDGTEKGGL